MRDIAKESPPCTGKEDEETRDGEWLEEEIEVAAANEDPVIEDANRQEGTAARREEREVEEPVLKTPGPLPPPLVE